MFGDYFAEASSLAKRLIATGQYVRQETTFPSQNASFRNIPDSRSSLFLLSACTTSASTIFVLPLRVGFCRWRASAIGHFQQVESRSIALKWTLSRLLTLSRSGTISTSTCYLCLVNSLFPWWAVRALAFNWIRILYKVWKSPIPYDESIYLEALKKYGCR